MNADPELQQYVRNVKMSVEDQKAKMRSVARGIFAAQVRHWDLWLGLLGLLGLRPEGCCEGLD